MKSYLRTLAELDTCEYLPDRNSQLEYEIFEELNRNEYHERLLSGWRRFGHSVFRPKCPTCHACQSLRILVDEYSPNNSQRRARKANEKSIQLKIRAPSLTAEKMELSARFHRHQEQMKGWSSRDREDIEQYFSNFIHNPFPTEEWNYTFEKQLVGVGYVDVLPDGLSAIYFYYEPEYRSRSLGTWNVLSLIDSAIERNLPYVYLGYYVEGSRSMEYKANFQPHELLSRGETWKRAETKQY